MRHELDAPLPLKSKSGLYRYTEGTAYELPGIWLKGEELVCLTELTYRLEELQAEFLSGSTLRPFVEKLESLLEKRKVPMARMNQKVRFLPTRMRKIDGGLFRTIMDGLFVGKQLKIRYQDREAGNITERMVSPQKMVRYRDNWYLDSYCHLREGIRSFALSGVLDVAVSKEKSISISQAVLQEYFASAYGFFGGKADKVAKIKLTGSACRRAMQESWHPQERRESLPGGILLLSIPYRDSRELLGDILQYGEEAEVLEPAELRREMVNKLKKVSKKYGQA
jgi:predicted DNA-binding transcriptional regulator YafY